MAIRNDQDLGHTLRTKREAAKLKQIELADKAGIRQRTVSDIENGKGCRSDTLFAILTAMGLEVSIADRAAPAFDPRAY